MIIVHPSTGVDITLVFNGALDPDAPVAVDTDSPEIAKISLTSYDAASFTAVVAVEHGSVAGTTAIRVRGDGDLGPGVTGIVWEDTFQALPVSATTVTASVGPERPTAQV
jgi:hypothetical protein